MTKLRFERYDHASLRSQGFHVSEAEDIAFGTDPDLKLWMTIDEGQTLAVFGYRILKEGYAEALLALHDMGKKYVSLPHVVREAFRHTRTSLRLYRAQAVVDAEDHAARKFAKYIGLEFEGHLRKAGINREDIILYAWIGDE